MYESEVVCGLEMNLQLISGVNHRRWPVKRNGKRNSDFGKY